ncbi:hypothetical protein [Streptomyces lasiicapitis]|uniref:hypothetical protein n=1 Tax=Streptomyces lasiicapitis TaxID=1923961 RepID=UPI00166BB020|nr:hypothetical protein [Streptomyces lasiicapitis]
MALSDGDVDGRSVRRMNNGLAAAMGKDSSIADPARCRPLDNMLAYGSKPAPKAFVPLSVDMKGSTFADPKGTSVVVALSSHDQAGAKQVLAQLRTALAKCGSGFESVNGTYDEVDERPVSGLGDEAVSYVMWGGVQGENAGASFTVVRSGATVVTFNAINLEKPWEVAKPDPAVVKAQLAKVEKAAR